MHTDTEVHTGGTSDDSGDRGVYESPRLTRRKAEANWF